MKANFLLLSSILALITGCASRPESGPARFQAPPTYPAYQGGTTYQGAPTYGYPAPMANQGTSTQSAQPAQAAPGTTTQTAPAATPEVIPSSPGPDYVWMPSYWTIGVGGNWVWVGGHYVLRQGVSEEQLRAARGMLEQARGSLTGKSLKNVDKAIDQINDALKVK